MLINLYNGKESKDLQEQYKKVLSIVSNLNLINK
jgi:hypothetical protein